LQDVLEGQEGLETVLGKGAFQVRVGDDIGFVAEQGGFFAVV